MSEVTVKQFADVVGISVDRLLVQLGEAGFAEKGADDTINDSEKVQLLAYLRRGHGAGEEPDAGAAEPRKITLKRKTVSALKHTGAQGKVKTVSVEVRKTRTYVKRSVLENEDAERVAAEEAVQRAAEQAVDDLLDIEGMDNERASQLIMTARAPWFADESQGSAQGA